MTDPTGSDPGSDAGRDETAPKPSPKPSPRPTPNPASRARRIGGRPAPRPAPAPAASPKPSPKPSPVDVTKAEAARKPASKAAGKPAVAPAPKKKVAPSAAAAVDRPDRATGSAGRAVPLRWLPASVLGLAALVLAVFVAIASHGVYWAKPDDSAGASSARQEQVLAAAKQCFHNVTSYDYRKLSTLVATDTACTTGTFKTQLTQSLKTQIIPNAPKQKAVQTSQVNRAGIVSVSDSGKQVVVLLFAQLTLSNNTTAKNSRIDVLGAVATMDRVGDRWLISNLDSDVGNSLSS